MSRQGSGALKPPTVKPAAALRRAQAALADGRAAEAEIICRRALAAAPRDVQLRALLGTARSASAHPLTAASIAPTKPSRNSRRW